MTLEELVGGLRGIAEESHDKPDTMKDGEEYPTDYEDTYHLGVTHGKLRSLRFILTLIDKYVDKKAQEEV